MKLFGVRPSKHRRSGAGELNCPNPIPTSRACFDNRMDVESECNIARRRPELRRHHAQKSFVWLKLLSSRFLELREAAAKVGNAPEHVAQQCGSDSGRSRVRAVGRRLQRS